MHHQYPDHGLNRLTERLILFRHDYNSQNMLLPINAASDVTDGALIEIIVSGIYLFITINHSYVSQEQT